MSMSAPEASMFELNWFSVAFPPSKPTALLLMLVEVPKPKLTPTFDELTEADCFLDPGTVQSCPVVYACASLLFAKIDYVGVVPP